MNTQDSGMEMTTQTGEIMESLKAIQVAAAERRTALLAEVRELEAAFPTISGHKQSTRAPRLTAEGRAALSAATSARWDTGKRIGKGAMATADEHRQFTATA